LKETVLARRYAKALFKLSLEKGVVDSILQELVSLEKTLEDSKEFRHFLYSRDVNRKKKVETVAMLLKEKVSPLFFNFFSVLLEKNREYIFPVVAVEFKRLVDKHHKVVHATVTTALPLEDKLLTQLKTLLDKRFDAHVQVENRVDASVLGGLFVNVEGQVFDGTLRNQLLRIERQLVEAA